MAQNARVSSSPQPNPPHANKPPTEVERVVDALSDRARRNASADSETDAQRRIGLHLAQVLLHLAAAERDAPPQIAVLGPTQSGKSTVVNLLLGAEHATASPLAGFTRHAQGFWLNPQSDSAGTLFEGLDPGYEDAAWAEPMFGHWRRQRADQLRPDELEAFSLERVQLETSLPSCVVWDTPDFDSIVARLHDAGLLSVLAAARVHVLVLSREKYADRSVWELMRLLAPLDRGTVLCLNKLTPEAADAIPPAATNLLQSARPGRPPLVVTLPSFTDNHAPASSVKNLRATVAQALSDASSRPRYAWRPLLQANWAAWTAPLRAQHAALHDWRTLVEEALAALLQRYRRDYLEHEDRFDSFRRATAELLQLLEPPGVAGALGAVRQAVTSPARRLWRGARTLFAVETRAPGGNTPSELAFLSTEFDALLSALHRDVLRRTNRGEPSERAVWVGIDAELERERGRLLSVFRQAAERHHHQVQREVHAAAGRLFEALKSRPALLNSLRGARVAADAASLAIAIKTGGLGPHDALLAPAMFAVTSLLTESAVGGYVQTVAAELRERQFADAQRELVEANIRRELLDVVSGLDDSGLFGVDRDTLAAADAALAHGRSA